MYIKYKKIRFNKYKFTIRINLLCVNWPNQDHQQFAKMNKWFNRNTQHVTLKLSNNKFRNLLFREYTFKLAAKDAIAFRIDFME